MVVVSLNLLDQLIDLNLHYWNSKSTTIVKLLLNMNQNTIFIIQHH